MNTRSLQVFLEVARTGSFSAAARNLGLTQPAVSFQIQSLEKEFGNVLVDRSAGRCRLTEAGQVMLRYAQRILKAEEELSREMEGKRTEPSGTLHMAASNIPGEYILPRIMAEFHRRYPLVEVRLTVTDTGNVLERVRAGEVDLGCVGFKGDEEERLHYGLLCSDRLVFIAPRGHPLAKKSRLGAADLLGQTLILREEGSGTRFHMLRILSDLGLDPGGMDCMVLGSTTAVLEAVASGMGISVSSLWAVEPYLRLRKVETLDIRDGGIRREFYYVHLRRRPQTPAALAITDLIEEIRPELEGFLASYSNLSR